MTAVCHGDKAEDEKHSGIRHSVFCSSHWCEGQDTKSWMLEGGNPCQECVGKADEQACPPFQCTLVFRACCPCFLISFCLCCPYDTEVHLSLNTLCFHFLSCSCLSEDVFHFTFFAFVELFPVPPVTSWPTASSLVLSFSAISYSGDKPQRMTWQRIGEKIAKRIPA